MRVTRLKLISFRNYGLLDLELPDGVTLLLGENAQGKTNVLEALLLLCVGRSHRTPRDREMIRWGDPQAMAQATLMRRDGQNVLEMRIPQTGRRVIKLNGSALRRTGEMLGSLNAVLFAPEDLSLVKEGPLERRRFVDMALSQLRPAYFYALQRYYRALKQRQSLLRTPRPADAELAAWDEQLALEGAHVMIQRTAMLERLGKAASAYHAALSGGSEELTLTYRPTVKGAITPSALYSALEKARPEDVRRCMTSVGPHRDDVALSLGGKDARQYASQGQQRTIALSLRLAQMDVIREDTGESPVLMLDDVFSELDASRQRTLLELTSARPAQTLITATDAPMLKAAATFRVKGGEVTSTD